MNEKELRLHEGKKRPKSENLELLEGEGRLKRKCNVQIGEKKKKKIGRVRTRVREEVEELRQVQR